MNANKGSTIHSVLCPQIRVHWRPLAVVSFEALATRAMVQTSDMFRTEHVESLDLRYVPYGTSSTSESPFSKAC